jgi:hypothetical protein
MVCRIPGELAENSSQVIGKMIGAPKLLTTGLRENAATVGGSDDDGDDDDNNNNNNKPASFMASAMM